MRTRCGSRGSVRTLQWPWFRNHVCPSVCCGAEWLRCLEFEGRIGNMARIRHPRPNLFLTVDGHIYLRQILDWTEILHVGDTSKEINRFRLFTNLAVGQQLLVDSRRGAVQNTENHSRPTGATGGRPGKRSSLLSHRTVRCLDV